eukprot:TRINITY_DN255_c0_g1_i4.p1 TRINITY_DN255_c0_g1~~TRINITY_DN255_c0_g1_i4.p1  ORF type:complete len:152 (+),score=80.33 TRINITY_DN255_c0_g1_i4:141-596(+)
MAAGVTYAEFVAKLTERATPKFVDGIWRRPALSSRKLAEIKKQCIAANVPWPTLPTKKHLDYVPPPPIVFKGHREQRDKIARQAKIKEQLAKMPKLIEDMRKAKIAERKKKVNGLLLLYGDSKENQPKWVDPTSSGGGGSSKKEKKQKDLD